MMIIGPEICHVDRCPHGCTSATGCGGHEQRRRAPAYYAARLDELVAEAASWGVDLRMPTPGGANENAQGHMKTNPPAAGRGEGDSHG